MAKNKIVDLRNHLFETIEMLKDGDEETSKMTVDKAKAISNVAQVIINSAKLEIEFMKVSDKMNGLSTVTEFLTIGSDDKKKLNS
jgi:hypothetical protein